MPSESARAYVWVWLPRAVEPVVCGVLERRGEMIAFAYAQSYLARPDAAPVYTPELPLGRGLIEPLGGLRAAGAIRDAAPDAWGQRVILNRLTGAAGPTADPGDLGLLTYLLQSGSDRAGNLDVQGSSSEYVARKRDEATLAELLDSAERLERGEILSPALDAALLHGSSIGGARPKAVLDDAPRTVIAKFSSTTDTYPVVKAEFVAMRLARLAGLDVASVRLDSVSGRDVLLVDRFDRPGDGTRRGFVSALTILGLDEMMSRYASYHALAVKIRERFTDPAATLRELFSRITFNILVGNTDDHARNHAAFYDPGTDLLTLTPAYDVCPQARSGGEAAQAMAIAENGWRMSQIDGCVRSAAVYRLAQDEAGEIAQRQIAVIREHWNDVCDLAGLTAAERGSLWHRQILNPYALEPSAGAR